MFLVLSVNSSDVPGDGPFQGALGECLSCSEVHVPSPIPAVLVASCRGADESYQFPEPAGWVHRWSVDVTWRYSSLQQLRVASGDGVPTLVTREVDVAIASRTLDAKKTTCWTIPRLPGRHLSLQGRGDAGRVPM